MEFDKTKKIGIFRALQLGDLLCSIPAIRALKSAAPSASIYLIGLPGMRIITERFSHYFNGFIPFPGYPGLPEQSYNVNAIAEFILAMQNEKFDLILQMQGNGTKVNQLIELLGARYCGGFYTSSDYKPPGDLFLPYPDYGHETERHLALMHHIGVPDGSVEMEFPLREEDLLAYDQLHLADKKYVCIHPGSRGSWRQWPRENFARMADLCIDNGLNAVITGTPEETSIVEEVAAKMKHKPVIAAGKTNLGSMGVMLKRSSGLVSNCTGVSHMAAALKVPGIIVSMDGEPQRWAPLDKDLFYTINWLDDPDYSKTESALITLIRNGSFSQGYGS
ncbi:MAG TPA: glycosyltransferase family 9 protein [Bacteroidales bacterium]|nr:glycosyltransferase family 9 protein [Bacteroidales bacterium]